MYSENKMKVSLNCIFLGITAFSDSFTVSLYEKNKIDDGEVDYDDLKIGHIKFLIYREKDIKINNYNELNLWKADLAYGYKLKDLTQEQICKDSEQLVPNIYFKKYFPNQDAVDKSLIFVQVPFTESQRKSIPFDRIQEELAQIIKDASQGHHMIEVDMIDVEKYQKQTLGRFYYKALPHGTKAADSMNLAMFGQMFEKAPVTDEKETLLDLVKGDVGENTLFKRVAMVGRSGAGKTATIVDLAKQHFVVYCVCSDPASFTTVDFADQNFVRLARDVEKMATNLNLQQPDSEQALKENDSRLKLLAVERVELEFLARFLLLQLLFEMKPDLTPEQFFRDQMNGGAKTIKKLVGILRKYDITAISDMLSYVQDYLKEHLDKKNQGLVIALDEAQIAGNRTLAGKLISSTVLDSPTELDSPEVEIVNIYQRGFLAPLCATLSHMPVTLVVLGTSLSLADAEQVSSAVGKKTNFRKITSFPSLNETDVDNLLKRAIDLSECVIPPDKRQKLAGRPRFSASVIGKLNDSDTRTKQDKQDVFNKAVDLAIDQHKKDLKSRLCKLFTNDKTGNIAHLLSRMVLAYKLNNGKVSFASISEADFVNNALCSFHDDSDGIHLIMDEPLVIEVVEEELKSRNIDPYFKEYLDQFNRVVQNLGINTTAKGNMLEPLVRRCLQRFNGCELTNLPFLKDFKELPTWCKDLKLQIDEVNTANGFGYNGQGHYADLEFLKNRPANKMLIEQSGTRQDGTWFFNKQYAGSIGIKIRSDHLKKDIHKENETSTDIRSSFLKKDGKLNPSLKKIREDFVASNIPNELKGILRIHLEFPGVKGSELKTRVIGVPNYEDVMVYIDCSNMDEFFYDDIRECQNDVRIIKGIIRHVTAKSGEIEV